VHLPNGTTGSALPVGNFPPAMLWFRFEKWLDPSWWGAFV
jgi:hypothetical protein